MKTLFNVLFILFVFGCSNNKKYTPENLRKLTQKEVIERIKNNQNANLEIAVYKSETGEIITLDSLSSMPDIKDWTADSYVDENNEVRELVLRKATNEDLEFEKKIREIINNKAQKLSESIDYIEIDCEKIAEVLQRIYASDQIMRKSGKKIDSDVDRQNLMTVINLIEQCKMPTLNEINTQQMTTIWLVFQHGDQYNRKKYMPILTRSAEKGDLKWSNIALMKDRTMMIDGEKQIYGSQVKKNYQTGKWELYDLTNPESVNERRAKVGLKPLQDYLKKWDIIFDISQQRAVLSN